MDPEQYQVMYDLEMSHWWYQGMRDIASGMLDRYLPRNGELRILDAGCGTGGNLQALQRYGSSVGVDFSPLALAYCRKRGLSVVALGSIDALPFHDASFDVLTSFDVLYHLSVQQDVGALCEFRRVLRTGGLLFVRVPALESLRAAHDRAVHTRERYSVANLRAKVERAGFEILRATYANSLLLPVVAGLRLAQRIGGRDSDHTGDVRPTARPLNAALSTVLGMEARLLQHVDLPVGVSAICVARAR